MYKKLFNMRTICAFLFCPIIPAVLGSSLFFSHEIIPYIVMIIVGYFLSPVISGWWWLDSDYEVFNNDYGLYIFTFLLCYQFFCTISLVFGIPVYLLLLKYNAYTLKNLYKLACITVILVYCPIFILTDDIDRFIVIFSVGIVGLLFVFICNYIFWKLNAHVLKME